MNLGLRIVIVVALQTAALFVMVGMKQYTLSTGAPIVLKTEPIDPRSLFSGDYVRLNYSISQLPIDQLAGDRTFERGDTIYVLLRQEEEFLGSRVCASRIANRGCKADRHQGPS